MMKITKYEHACLDITEGDSRLIIDPGEFASSLTNIEAIDCVVITHIHGDHFNPYKLKQIYQLNPEVKIYTTSDVAEKLVDLKAEIAKPGKTYVIGEIELEFFGEDHAVIDPRTPVVQNIGVLVNSKLYYPGDSFTECTKQFQVLAVPSSAPWMRVGEMIPMIESSQCSQVFPTHNFMLSEVGHQFSNNWLREFAERSGKTFSFLSPGDSIEI